MDAELHRRLQTTRHGAGLLYERQMNTWIYTDALHRHGGAAYSQDLWPAHLVQCGQNEPPISVDYILRCSNTFLLEFAWRPPTFCPGGWRTTSAITEGWPRFGSRLLPLEASMELRMGLNVFAAMVSFAFLAAIVFGMV